jgi:hypothetical protein
VAWIGRPRGIRGRVVKGDSALLDRMFARRHATAAEVFSAVLQAFSALRLALPDDGWLSGGVEGVVQGVSQ